MHKEALLCWNKGNPPFLWFHFLLNLECVTYLQTSYTVKTWGCLNFTSRFYRHRQDIINPHFKKPSLVVIMKKSSCMTKPRHVTTSHIERVNTLWGPISHKRKWKHVCKSETRIIPWWKPTFKSAERHWKKFAYRQNPHRLFKGQTLGAV